MNAHEAYQETLKNIERLKSEQLVEINGNIETATKCGRFYCLANVILYTETQGDLTIRGFMVNLQDGNYTKISWDPKIIQNK